MMGHGLVPSALIRAKYLRIRLVKGFVLDKQGWGGAGRSAPFFAAPDHARKASGLNFMSTKRMTLAHQRLANRWGFESLARTLRVVTGLAVAATVLGACSSATEIWDKVTQKDDTFVEEPAEKLYNEGLFLTNEKGDPKGGAKKFEEVDRQHPYSDLARKSLLMSAYSFYRANDYDSCIGAATRYVTLHPGSPDAAYAQFLIAASHYDQIADITRDQSRTEKAIAALEEVVRKYPTSEYAVSAKAKLEAARDQLAGREMNVGRYYLQKRNFTAAINRFKTVVTQYQTTRHVEEALARLTEAYMSAGIVSEAQTAAAVLGHNFPDSPWYKDAYNLVRSGGLEPSENQDSPISRAFKKLGLARN
jgi:outer membrane protein assembly factor BamD